MIKVVLVSISGTLIVVTFIATMFLNSILGVFSLASTSIETLSNLQESKHIVDTVKKRHQKSKLIISKRFTHRARNRIAASAVSASTIGTAAVVVAVVGFEMYDYCEDKKEWTKENNILFNNDEEFDYSECWNEAKNDTATMVVSIKESVPETVSSTWEATKDISKESWQKTKRITFDTWKSTKSVSSETWNSTVDTTDKLWDSLINYTY